MRFCAGLRWTPRSASANHAFVARESGATMEEVLENYPQLKREDVLAAIAYGAEMSRERYVDLPGGHTH